MNDGHQQTQAANIPNIKFLQKKFQVECGHRGRYTLHIEGSGNRYLFMLGFLSFSKYHPFLVWGHYFASLHFGLFEFQGLWELLGCALCRALQGSGNRWVGFGFIHQVATMCACASLGTQAYLYVYTGSYGLGLRVFWASLGLVFRFEIYVFFILLGGLDI